MKQEIPKRIIIKTINLTKKQKIYLSVYFALKRTMQSINTKLKI